MTKTKTNQKINPSNVVIGDEFITLLKEDGDIETKRQAKARRAYH